MLTYNEAIQLAANLEMLEQLARQGMQNGYAAKLVRLVVGRQMKKLLGREVSFDVFGFPIGLTVAAWDAVMAARETLYRERLAARAAQEREQAERDRVTRAYVEAAQFAAGVTA